MKEPADFKVTFPYLYSEEVATLTGISFESLVDLKRTTFEYALPTPIEAIKVVHDVATPEPVKHHIIRFDDYAVVCPKYPKNSKPVERIWKASGDWPDMKTFHRMWLERIVAPAMRLGVDFAKAEINEGGSD